MRTEQHGRRAKKPASSTLDCRSAPVMRTSLPTPAELEAVRKEIEDLKNKAAKAEADGKERLYLTLLEVLVPLRHKEERLAKGE